MSERIEITFVEFEEPIVVELNEMPYGRRNAFWDYNPERNIIFIPRSTDRHFTDKLITEAMKDYRATIENRRKQVQKFLDKYGIRIDYRE